MNQDQLKDKILPYSEHKDFTLIFSGKKSSRVDGLYCPETKEIIIHNKNFSGEADAIYTALHELSHHEDFTKNRNEAKRRAHGAGFWAIFDRIVQDAVENGDFEPISEEVTHEAVEANKAYTEALRKLGKELIKCIESCNASGYPFEDVVRRILKMKKSEAEAAIKICALDISGDIGGDLAKKITKIINPQERLQAEQKQKIPSKLKTKELDEYAFLAKEKERLEKVIDKSHNRLEEINLLLEGHNEEL